MAGEPKPKPNRTEVAEEELRRVRRVLRALKRLYPDAHCALEHRNAYELTVATILSAQCTDERVNLTTPALFDRYPTAADLAVARQEDVEGIVQSCGFYRNKAKNLIGMAKKVVADHGGEIPETMDEMLALPGVARKTANVVLGNAFGIASGVVVDTHVQRLSTRLGLTRESTPVKIEEDLQHLVPKKHWVQLSHELIWHGRKVCDARKPRCDECKLARDCPAAETEGAPPTRRRSAAETLGFRKRKAKRKRS